MVPGKVMAADVAGAETTASSVQGGELIIDGNGGVTVNGAISVSLGMMETPGCQANMRLSV